jgi:hypothetical protein
MMPLLCLACEAQGLHHHISVKIVPRTLNTKCDAIDHETKVSAAWRSTMYILSPYIRAAKYQTSAVTLATTLFEATNQMRHAPLEARMSSAMERDASAISLSAISSDISLHMFAPVFGKIAVDTARD